MQPFLDEQGFDKTENGYFQNKQKSIKIEYDENRQMYLLLVADIENEKVGKYTEINAWLFDDTQNAKDAVSVGIDFTASLRKLLGIKTKRASNTEIELPSFSKSGSITITGFTKKMLDFFPSIKDGYKEHITKYGNFLYLNFFGQYLVPQISTVLLSDNKKQIKKLFDLLDDLYIKGDKDTVNAIVAILCATAHKDIKAVEIIHQSLETDKHFLSSFENFLPIFPKSKKLLTALSC